MSVTKKRIIIILTVLIILLALGYKAHVDNKTDEALRKTERTIKLFKWAKETDEVKIHRIIKRSPKEIIMVVRWEENKAYVNIERWLTKAGDKIVINMFDKEKGVVGYE